MNDQWSGKILSNALRTTLAPPKRSSVHRASRGRSRGRTTLFGTSALRVPDAGPDRVAEVARGDHVTVAVDREGQLRQRPGGGPEDGIAVVGYVEGRLVAGAQQQPGPGLVQADGAAHVRAEL